MTRPDSMASGSKFLGEVAQRSLSRRSLLRWGALAGSTAVLAPAVTACVGPSAAGGGAAGASTLTLGPEPLAGQPGQQAQPVRRRRHRPARRPPGPHRNRRRTSSPSWSWPRPLRTDQPHPVDRPAARATSGTPTAPPVPIEDVVHGPGDVQQVNGSFVAPQFPEWPTVVPEGRPDLHPGYQGAAARARLADVQHPDYPGRSQQARRAPGRRRHRPVQGGHQVRPRHRHVQPERNENYWGQKPAVSEVQRPVHARGIQPRGSPALR